MEPQSESSRGLGMKIWEPAALALFKDAVAEVDEKAMMMRIPENLLKETVRIRFIP